MRAQVATIEKPYRDKLQKQKLEEELKKFPEDIRIAVETPADKRTPGQKLLVSQLQVGGDDPDAAAAVTSVIPPDDPNHQRNRAPIKVSAEDDAKRKVLLAQIKEIEKKMPTPLQ